MKALFITCWMLLTLMTFTSSKHLLIQTRGDESDSSKESRQMGDAMPDEDKDSERRTYGDEPGICCEWFMPWCWIPGKPPCRNRPGQGDFNYPQYGPGYEPNYPQYG